jgi:hypothetical protein
MEYLQEQYNTMTKKPIQKIKSSISFKNRENTREQKTQKSREVLKNLQDRDTKSIIRNLKEEL